MGSVNTRPLFETASQVEPHWCSDGLSRDGDLQLVVLTDQLRQKRAALSARLLISKARLVSSLTHSC